jgi:hypothetical protein
MKFARRLFRTLHERGAVALFGSALWWTLEHLMDKGVDQMIHILTETLPRI